MRIRITLWLFVLLLASWNKNMAQIVINPAVTYQTMEGFGASDCWTVNFVGQYWNTTQKENIARYLFSQDVKSDGSPEGIGLSMWRFNLGAGTYEQGNNSDIEDLSRRAECFLDNTGENYDWSKQAGQQWFLQKAKEYGCESFVAFSNSPPVFFTRNGKGYTDDISSSNLREDAYDDFAGYMADVLKHFEEEGLEFSYISPINEPQHPWNERGQEGSPWHNSEIKQLAVELDKALTERSLNTKMLLAEAGHWTDLYSGTSRATNQIYEFFDPQSENYLADLPTLANGIAGHSYWTHNSDTELRTTRQRVKRQADQYGIDVFQTEWSLLSIPPASMGFANSIEEASYMDIALFMAKIIYSDLADAGVSSWSYWTSMDMERWSHKNRFFLIELRPGGWAYNDIRQPGQAYDNENLWALGNYSFFVRPGFKRIEMTRTNYLNSLMGTAFLAPDSSQIVCVFVNMSYNERNITPSLSSPEGFVPAGNRLYVTDSSSKLRKQGGASDDLYLAGKTFTLPPRSVSTLVYDFEKQTTSIFDTEIENAGIKPVFDRNNNVLYLGVPPYFSGKKADVTIYTVSGKKIIHKSLQIENVTEQIRFPSVLPAGIYLVVMEVEGQLFREKFIIR